MEELPTPVRVRAKTTRSRKKAHEIKSFVRRSSEAEIRLTTPTEFFEKMSRPVESRLYSWTKDVESSTTEQLDLNGVSRIVEVDPMSGKWRFRKINSTQELREIMKNSERAHGIFMKLREANLNKFLSKEDSFGGYGFADDYPTTSGSGLINARAEFTPLIGTPFYKQMYLYDYWEMHSKCFWYRNYSGIAKMVIEMTRNFVLGKGFNVDFDNEKAQAAWDAYEERSNIQEEIRNWCDELTTFGENMIKKIPGPGGIIHRSFDPSTIWEIVTDPENISDIKYYHQQYNTQYQLYGTKDAPVSKYIINQIPPQLVHHTKINVTSYEKRGRSDLLAALLYFKYYEDYMVAKLTRAKNEAAFIWDVEIDGSDEDVNYYLTNSQNIADVPPGSENVHNKAVKRTPLSPQFGKASGDQVAQDILSYIAMGVAIPVNYFGTFGQAGNTRAGALVATEPVAKKMLERQMKMEHLVRKIVKDVLVSEGMNPLDPKNQFEVNFPEILEEDSSAKIQNVLMARDNNILSHRTAAMIVAKELKITKYDYEKEQDDIIKDQKSNSGMFMQPNPDLTGFQPGSQTTNSPRALDRDQVKKDGLTL